MKKLLASITLTVIMASFLNVSVFANTTYFPNQMYKSFNLNNAGEQDVAKISVTDPAKINSYYKQYEKAYNNIMASESFEIGQEVEFSLSVDKTKSQIFTNSLIQQVDLTNSRIANNIFSITSFVDSIYDAKSKTSSINVNEEDTAMSNLFFKDDVLYYESQEGKYRVPVMQDDYFDTLYGNGFLPFDVSKVKKVYTQNYVEGQYVTFLLNDEDAKIANQLATETTLAVFNLTADDTNQKGNEVAFSFFFDKKGNLVYTYNEFTTYISIDGISTKISSIVTKDILIGETEITVPKDLNAFKYVNDLNFLAE